MPLWPMVPSRTNVLCEELVVLCGRNAFCTAAPVSREEELKFGLLLGAECVWGTPMMQ